MDIYKYDKILVLHYGKVASNTLVFSLANQLNYKRKHIKCNRNYTEQILTTFNNYKFLINKYEKILVISICRNLIDRCISMLFQLKGEKYVKQIKNKEITKEILFNNLLLDLNKYKFKNDKYYLKLQKDFNMNFDIYKTFNKETKYLFKEQKKCDFLLLTKSNINNWPNIFFKLFNFKLNLESFNLTCNKGYNKLYKEFLEFLKVNNNIINAKYKKTLHYKYFDI